MTAPYSEFFLNSPSSIVQLELLEISHPNFSKTYYVVRNANKGVTVTHEDATVHDYQYYPLRIRKSESNDTLDTGFQIDLGDLGEIVPQEIENIAVADGFATKPTMIYRAYRSDDLTAPLVGPLELEVTPVAVKDVSSFTAKAPSLNNNRTGEFYKISRFPMMIGFR